MHPWTKEIRERCFAIGCVNRRENLRLPYCTECFASLSPELQASTFERSLARPSIVDKPLDIGNKPVTSATMIFLRRKRWPKTKGGKIEKQGSAATGYTA